MADFLREYHLWKRKSKQISADVGGVSYDGMPKAPVKKDPAGQLDAHANAKNECWKRQVIVDNLRDVGDQYTMLADILSWRYLHEFSQRKCMRLVAEHYGWDMSDKTFRLKQEAALDQALGIIPWRWLDEWQPLDKKIGHGITA